MCVQEPLDIQCGPAAGCRSRHCLPVVRILYVTGRKDTLDIGPGCLALGDDISVFVSIDPFAEEVGIRMVSNPEEKAVDLDIKNLTIFPENADSGHTGLVAEDFLGIAIPENFDVRCGSDALLHRLGCPEDIPAYYHIDFGAEVCQIGGLLAGSVPASDHCNDFLPVEESVAGGAGRYAEPLEFLLRRKSKIFGHGSCSNDDGLRLDDIPLFILQSERPLRKVNPGDPS